MNWTSNTCPISDIREWRDTNKLEIRPDFQRNAVWSRAAQIMLIDTIINDIPMPKIYFETKMVNGVKYRIVIDGQQRLTAIFNYIDGEFVLPEKYGEEWANKKFDDLSEEQQNVILGYEIDSNNLNNPSQDEVNSLYSRVNKYTVQLNNQELRRADFPGDFIVLAEKLASLDFFGDSRMFTANMTRRMLDIEYIEELLCILLEGLQNKKETIDDFCSRFQVMDNKHQIEEEFCAILEDVSLIFTIDGEMLIRKTRFKQRSDFYTLFSVIAEKRKCNKRINESKIEELRKNLKYLNDNIEPYSEFEELSNYAIHCTSDANSLSSRQWRKEFMNKYFSEVYK